MDNDDEKLSQVVKRSGESIEVLADSLERFQESIEQATKD